MQPLVEHYSQLSEITYVHGVPKIVWCFWSGPKMNAARRQSFNVLRENIGLPVCLVTAENIQEFIQPGFDLHPAYPYLSVVHQSDYIRAYLWHHYGGAWHDIKATEVSFDIAWREFENPNILMVGKPETPSGPARVNDREGRWMPDYWRDLVSVVAWIGRPNTPMSEEFMLNLHELLDKNMDVLKKYPAKHPREKRIETKGVLSGSIRKIRYLLEGRNIYYPLPWTVFGNIFHPLNYKYRDQISKVLPQDKIKNAGIYHRR